MMVLMVVLVALLAFANGANDNCKGVAMLVGYGAARPVPALIWATLTTALGAVISFWAAGGLIEAFSIGLFVQGTTLNGAFFACALTGACGWVLLATLTGLPVSTTHAIAGALTGAGLLAFGTQSFEWSFLGSRIAIPLATSPVLSLAVVYLISWPVGLVLTRLAGRCVCVTSAVPVVVGGGCAGEATASLIVGTNTACAELGAKPVASTSVAANGLHWLSSGMVGLARGWNDAPKIAALGITALGPASAVAVVTIAMAVGGLLAGRKVLDTLSRKVTAMPLVESLTASLVTATLVSFASWRALPMSTTHVSTGAIIGAGLKRDPRQVHWSKVAQIVISWVVTLPAAALFAAAARLVIR